ncbi:radial spoke head 14 homolog [Amia ocellicauda]|uniref:radial spoke head 14 homolog n=1 Tax=Amia ocellicauda TaxID=2972642 RepID=UPI003463B2BE|nr:RSP14 protein [Amia calva]
MTGTRISVQLPPNIDPTKAPVAFGDRAVPRLSRELRSAELLTRQRALMSLCDLVRDPERAYELIQAGCLESLKLLLCDEDSTVRLKTTELLYLLANHNSGREALLSSDVISPLSDLLEEPLEACRWNTHRVLQALAELPPGALGVLEAGLVPRLVLRLSKEGEAVQELILTTLGSCLRVDALPALASDGVSALRVSLIHPSPRVRAPAARALVAISVPLEGKVKLCEEGVVPELVRLLGDDNAEVRGHAAAALMNTAVTTQGKFLALEAGAVPALLVLAQCPGAVESCNALRCLTCLAEAPPGRAQLLPYVPLLQQRLSHPSDIVRQAALTAIQVITWTP